MGRTDTAESIRQLSTLVESLASQLSDLSRRIREREPVIVFIDYSNFYSSVNRIRREGNAGWRMDFPKLKDLLLRDRFCMDILCYYSELQGYRLTDEERINQERRNNLYTYLERTVGFRMIRHNQVRNQSGAIREKGLDTAIVRDMVNAARDCPRCHTFVLVAGDGDYSETIAELKYRHGIRVEVAFFRPETAVSLREAAYEFVDLETYKDHLEQVDEPRRPTVVAI